MLTFVPDCVTAVVVGQTTVSFSSGNVIVVVPL
jgi:hypothetical protein